MKNSILIASAFLFMGTSMVSCKKDYTCKCAKTYSNGNSSSTADYSVYIYKDNRKRAEDRCNDNTTSGSDFFGNYSVNCQVQ